MKEFIYPEMMVHVPLCTSKDPKKVLMISENASRFAKEMLKYKGVKTKAIEPCLDAISNLEDGLYDVIICEMESDEKLLAQIERISKEDALLCITHPSLDEVDANKVMMKNLARYFKVIMPFNVGGGKTALLASKEYHPTADIILQRADMLDDNEYYNCDIHIAAFAMGNYIRKEYLGIIKN
jgi:spermidine synthase